MSLIMLHFSGCCVALCGLQLFSIQPKLQKYIKMWIIVIKIFIWEVYCRIYGRKSRFRKISIRISDDIPPQMKVLSAFISKLYYTRKKNQLVHVHRVYLQSSCIHHSSICSYFHCLNQLFRRQSLYPPRDMLVYSPKHIMSSKFYPADKKNSNA